MRKVGLALLLVVMLGAASSAQDRVIEEALSTASPLERNLQVLTDEIGGRITGTPQYAAAEQWAIKGFKEAGADSVTTEEFAIPQSWAEGATEISVEAPVKFRVRGNSLAWAPPLKTTARVVDVGEGSPADFAKAGDLTGAILLVHFKVLEKWEDLFTEYFRAPPIIDAAVKGKAAAIAWMASREHDVLYRHNNTLSGTMDKLPQVLIAREDALRIARLIAGGKKVRMSISAPNIVGPAIHAHNVIAEIKGTDLPNEVVILAAHLDSWELGTGALDNGCNAALTIDALRAIHAAGVKPRRTLRFILFGGEEQGMFGSLVYVRSHRKDLDKVAGMIVVDSGNGAFTGWSTQGHKEMDAALKPLVEPFAQWKATAITDDAEIGTDNYDFMVEGVATILPNQEEFNYLKNYHATSDTYDKVDFPQLRKNEAMSAELMVELANARERIGRRYTRKEIEATFPETHLDDGIKGFGLWDDWVNGTRGRKD